MFEVGWTEMLVIAVVMIVVVGPKDLPRMLRTIGKTTSKLRSMAGDFRKQFDEALKEAELDDVKKSVDQLRSMNPASEIKKQLNPFEKAAAEVRAGLESAMKPKPAGEAASSVAHPAEPLKNGATAMPSVPGPSEMPVAPTFSEPSPATVAGQAAAAGITAPAANRPAAKVGAGAARKPAVSKGVPAPAGKVAASKAAVSGKPAAKAGPKTAAKLVKSPVASKVASAAKPKGSAS